MNRFRTTRSSARLHARPSASSHAATAPAFAGHADSAPCATQQAHLDKATAKLA